MEPERRDFTTEAKTILQLLADLLAQKNGYGATLKQVTDNYFGTHCNLLLYLNQ